MMDRHLDQLLMCAIYVMAKVRTAGNWEGKDCGELGRQGCCCLTQDIFNSLAHMEFTPLKCTTQCVVCSRIRAVITLVQCTVVSQVHSNTPSPGMRF